ncbi:hypothetical protein K438DRAFT_853863 [Mycena galopus ATCC 62051]|nr:hypothetical protein K438DRAFT_853863 [Mycena galopus ATCC 62051]
MFESPRVSARRRKNAARTCGLVAANGSERYVVNKLAEKERRSAEAGRQGELRKRRLGDALCGFVWSLISARVRSLRLAHSFRESLKSAAASPSLSQAPSLRCTSPTLYLPCSSNSPPPPSSSPSPCSPTPLPPAKPLTTPACAAASSTLADPSLSMSLLFLGRRWAAGRARRLPRAAQHSLPLPLRLLLRPTPRQPPRQRRPPPRQRRPPPRRAPLRPRLPLLPIFGWLFIFGFNGWGCCSQLHTCQACGLAHRYTIWAPTHLHCCQRL